METRLQSLKLLIANRTGLVIRDEDEKEFRTVVAGRLKKTGLAGMDEYYRLLEASPAKNDREWKKLVSFLTVGESYFFRDSDQFTLLRDQILPELISRHQRQRSLNIWSAGCSTGEEAYSLAMVIDELLPERQDWKIAILGTDINEEAIEKAKSGVFGAWSFRRVSPDVKKRYFSPISQGWQLDERIRLMVDFRVENLLDTHSGLGHAKTPMDLIVCRNVFIYFNREAITRALNTLCRVLGEEGYLVTGHGELLGQSPVGKGLRVIVHPESVLYQKMSRVQAASRQHLFEARVQRPPLPVSRPFHRARRPFTASPAQRPKPVADRTNPNAGSVLESPFRDGQYLAVIETGQRLIKEDPRNFEAYSFMARSYANLGLYEEATEMCRKMLELHAESVIAYLLLAHIAEARENYEEAKKLLKKVIYLEPKYVAAYIELSGIYDREHDNLRAETMRRSALELLKSLPTDAMIQPYEEVTAKELIGYFTEGIR